MWCLGNMWNWSFTLLETGNKQGKVSKIFTMKLSLKFLFRFPLLSVWYLCYLLDMWQVCLYFLLECWKKVQMCQLLPRSAASPELTQKGHGPRLRIFCIANDKLWIHHKVETLQLFVNTADRWTRFMTSDLKIYSVFASNNGAASPDQAESLRGKGVNNSSW